MNPRACKSCGRQFTPTNLQQCHCCSLVERAGKFDAYDIAGRHLGAFGDMRTAARAIPPAVEDSQ